MAGDCPKCGGEMEAGVAGAVGLLFAGSVPREVPRLRFIVPGSPTSSNPVRAVMQGLADEPDTREFPITGKRCVRCGFLELYAFPEAR